MASAPEKPHLAPAWEVAIIILVCGGRDFQAAELLADTLDRLHRERGFTLLIHGAARGADGLAGDWAISRRIPVRAFPADWTTLHRAADPLHNAPMLMEGKPDLVVAFPGGQGTANMVRQARAAGVEVVEVAG